MSSSDLLKRVQTKAIAAEEFEKELWQLSKGHARRGRAYDTDKVRIYRTRAWSDSSRPRLVSDLSYPPKEFSRLNRANLEGEQVFYASAGLPPSFVESRLQSGQFVVCGEWRNTMRLVVQSIGIPGDNDPSGVEEIYREIFTSTDSSAYLYSARVAHHLMSGPQISGLLYPSIAAQNNSHNLALKADFVDKGMRLVNASFYLIKEAKADHQYETEELDFAIPDSSGALEWKGRRRNWVLRKQGEELKFVSNGWTFDAYAPDGSLVDPE